MAKAKRRTVAETPILPTQDDLEVVGDTMRTEDDTAVARATDAAHTPVLSGGDVDAAWDQDSGEESVGGSSPTPDQDRVDDLGRAAGVTYQDEQPLALDKTDARDDERWELDPASSEDFEERTRAQRRRTPPP